PLGAPTHLKPEFFHDAIKEIVSKDSRCAYIDGRASPFVARSSSDPVHFSKTSANALADKLFSMDGGIKDLITRHNLSGAINSSQAIEQNLQAPQACSECVEH